MVRGATLLLAAVRSSRLWVADLYWTVHCATVRAAIPLSIGTNALSDAVTNLPPTHVRFGDRDFLFI